MTNLPIPPTIPSTTDGWLKLADYGDHPHSRGLQRLTPQAAAQIVRTHQGLYARLRRYFGGVPVYIGHPDDPAYSGQAGHADTRAYGWIHDIAARPDGLYIRPRWSAEGRRLLDNAHYKHLSPRWKMRENPDGTWSPIELVSVGLTNMPNIAGPTIANEKPMRTTKASLTEKKPTPKYQTTHMADTAPIAAALGLPQGASPADIAAAIEAIRAATAAATDRLALINARLDLALERGQITPNQRHTWQERMQSTKDEATAELLSLPRNAAYQAAPMLSNSIAHASYTQARSTLQAQFLRTVEERMHQTGEDYTTAWAAIKERRRDIFHRVSSAL